MLIKMVESSQPTITYTRMVTMQNLFHDGGFSFTGVSQGLIEDLQKAYSEEAANG